MNKYRAELVDLLFSILNMDKDRVTRAACVTLADAIVRAVKEEIMDNLA